MIYYTLRIFLFLLLTLPAFATQNNHSFYVATALGIDKISGKRTGLARDPTPPITDRDFSVGKSLRSISAALDMRVGYMYKFSQFGLGIEALGGHTKLEDTHKQDFLFQAVSSNQYEIKQKLTTYAGLQARGGYIINDLFIYALAGIHIQKIQWHLHTFMVDLVGGNPAESIDLKINKQKLAPCFGIGFQKALTPQFDIGLEFKATLFKKFKLKWERYHINAHNIHSSFKNTLYSIRLKFTYNI